MAQRMARRLTSDHEVGASAVEYSLVVVAIAAIIVIVVFALGRMTDANFGKTCQAFESQVVSSASCGP